MNSVKCYLRWFLSISYITAFNHLQYFLPVFTSLNVTLLCTFNVSLRPGWPKSLSIPPPEAVAILLWTGSKMTRLVSLDPNMLSR